jgi:phosphatidate cytidylyltransferase
MLKQRVITALVLVAVLLPTLMTEATWPFALYMAVAMVAATWEWQTLNGASRAQAVGVAAGVAVVLGALSFQVPVPTVPAAAWLLTGLLWLACGAWSLRAGPGGWGQVPAPWRQALGPLILVAAWLAMVQVRSVGLNFLLSVFCLVWMADIAAYFGGRALGRRKLAPSISPGKSWEGAWSGLLGVLLLALAWIAWDRHTGTAAPSLFTRLWLLGGGLGMLLGLPLLVAMSVVGDLFESLVKRSAGAKDSSQLLPGHGGVLDRIDALLPVFPLAVALTLAWW